MSRDVLVLCSGGPDSLVLAERARLSGRLRMLLFAWYDHPANREESAAVFRYMTAAGVEAVEVNMTAMHARELANDDGPRVVPGRNLVLLSVAINRAAALGCSEVWIGANAADQRDYPDCRPGYLDAVSALGAPWGVRVVAPLVDTEKPQIIEEAARLGVLDGSWSCYAPVDRDPCGCCASCVERGP